MTQVIQHQWLELRIHYDYADPLSQIEENCSCHISNDLSCPVNPKYRDSEESDSTFYYEYNDKNMTMIGSFIIQLLQKYANNYHCEGCRNCCYGSDNKDLIELCETQWNMVDMTNLANLKNFCRLHDLSYITLDKITSTDTIDPLPWKSHNKRISENLFSLDNIDQIWSHVEKNSNNWLTVHITNMKPEIKEKAPSVYGTLMESLLTTDMIDQLVQNSPSIKN